MCIYASVCTYLCICVCVYEAANHRLIGAIRELAEQHSIAAPDGQLEVDTLHVDSHSHIQNTHKHTHTLHIYMKHTLCKQTHGVH